MFSGVCMHVTVSCVYLCAVAATITSSLISSVSCPSLSIHSRCYIIINIICRKEKKDSADQLRTSTELTEIHEELESNEETSTRISREFQVIP